MCLLKNEFMQLILSNGSERSDFVPMDYIFSQMNKIHDGIQIMKTYYPLDEMWNPKKKISEITLKKNVSYSWDFEYEDYPPLDIFEENSIVLNEIKQIKLYGADIHLTLTMDLSLSDNDIIKIVKKLNPFGRIFLRINHETNGHWFRFNRQYTYKEVNDFFVRCHKIIKNNSSNIFTVFNISADFFVREKIVRSKLLRLSSDELQESLNIADYWSIDKYVSLNYGWPFEKMSVKKGNFFTGTLETWWLLLEESYINMIWKNNLKAKKIFISEFNSDSDIEGYAGQAKIIEDVYNRLSSGQFEWIEGIVMYQFRDKGGLGLEKGDLKSFKKLPALNAYKKAINKFKYIVFQDESEWSYNDYTFNWENSNSIRGLMIDNIEEKKKLINKFGVPIYIMYGDNQIWKRLEPDSCFILNKFPLIYIFIPPFSDSDENERIFYSKMIRDIKDKILKMFE